MRFMEYTRPGWTRYDVSIKETTEYIGKLSQKKIDSSSRYFGKNKVITSSTISNYIKSINGFYKWLNIY